MQEDLKYWVALSTNLAIGAKTFKKLDHAFQSMEEVWHAKESDFLVKHIDQKMVKLVIDTRNKINPDKELENVLNQNIIPVNIYNEYYPEMLKEIPDAPALMYVKGSLENFKRISIGVVGSRKFTYYGKKAVEKIVKPLASEGVVIISGLALGIDSLAHKATLDSGGYTIAIVGNGLDRVYPEINKHLADDIISKGGTIVSEFPLGTPSYKQNFPFRNRIIAGLSQGVLVVQAALKSGSLITASVALDYNRQVYAVPGDIFESSSEGPNNLIKMGAKPVTEANDIFEDLNIARRTEQKKISEIVPDTKEEAIVLEYINENPIYVDKLFELTKLDIATLNTTLTMMEMKGKVRNIGGNQYIIG